MLACENFNMPHHVVQQGSPSRRMLKKIVLQGRSE